MKRKPAREFRHRRGAIAILSVAMLTVLLGMAAFSVDYGYILTARTDLQGAADAAVLAAARELTPDNYGWQGYSAYRVNERIRDFANSNINAAGSFQIPDADIEIGRYDPATIYSPGPLTLLNDGILDTVRVTLRQDGVNNDSIPLFFARVLGFDHADVVVTATAILPPVKVLRPGDGILPFAVDINEWNAMSAGDQRSIYADGTMEDSAGDRIPGNWGTVDIGDDNNSTDDIGEQILEGLRQSDLDALASSTALADGQPRIPDSSELAAPLWVDADTGISTALKAPLDRIIGIPKIVPLFGSVSGTGDTAEYRIIGWGVVMVTEVDLLGALADRHLTVQRTYMYEGTLTANADLRAGIDPITDIDDNIQGAYAAAMLVE